MFYGSLKVFQTIALKASLYISNCFALKKYHDTTEKLIANFEGSCLKTDQIFAIYRYEINCYIDYKLFEWSKDIDFDFPLGKLLFQSID